MHASGVNFTQPWWGTAFTIQWGILLTMVGYKREHACQWGKLLHAFCAIVLPLIVLHVSMVPGKKKRENKRLAHWHF